MKRWQLLLLGTACTLAITLIVTFSRPPSKEGSRSAVAGSASTPPQPGIITGRLMNLVGFDAYPVTGKVRVRSTQGRYVTSAVIGRDGTFHFMLPPGTYVLSGESPQFNGRGTIDECHARDPIVLVSSETVRAIVGCEGP